MEILIFIIVPAILVGIFKGLADWTPPGGPIGGRDAFLFYVTIVLVSLTAFLVSSLPLLDDQIDAFSFMLYYFTIGVGVLWTLHFIVVDRSEYWGKVFTAASTLLPVWWFTLMDSFWKFVYRLLHQ